MLRNDGIANPPVYSLLNEDLSNATTQYFGFTTAQGEWAIIKAVTASSVTTRQIIEGTSDFDTNWTNRAALTYNGTTLKYLVQYP